MQIAELRAELGLSLEGFAQLLGLNSKGYVHALEGENPRCSVKVALDIEKISDGRISADSLNPDVGLVRNAKRGRRARSCTARTGGTRP